MFIRFNFSCFGTSRLEEIVYKGNIVTYFGIEEFAIAQNHEEY